MPASDDRTAWHGLPARDELTAAERPLRDDNQHGRDARATQPDSSSKIQVVGYDATWPATFAWLRDRIAPALAGVAEAIEHVGSTGVPGLAAKPVIDLDVIVPDAATVPVAIARLATLGYAHRGDLGIAGREAFVAPIDLPRHHLYVCVRGNLALRNHLALRDRLRADAVLARAYGDLKRSLAARFPDDIDAYVDGKSAFIAAILRDAGIDEASLARIVDANAKR